MKYFLSSLVLVAVIAVVAFVPTVARAHGEEVLTFTATTTQGYIVDIDYTGLMIEAGVSGSFIFNLFSDDTRLVERPFKDLWVRVIEEDGTEWGRTIFAGPISKPEFGAQGFLYVFPKSGEYRLAVRYNQEGKTKGSDGEGVTAEIPLTVYRGLDEEKFKFSTEFFAGIGAGAIGLLVLLLPLIMRRKISSEPESE